MNIETTVEKSRTASLKETIASSMSYEEYRILVAEKVASKSSTGPNQSEAYVNYTKLSDARMRRLDKTIKISKALNNAALNYDKKVTWLILTESWCGDAAQSMPVFHKIEQLNSNIKVKVALRDDNIETMQYFLTNGGMSIPKLVAIDEITNKVIGEWGPRPTVATKMVSDYKAEHGMLTPAFKQDLQVWYTKDKATSIMEDALELL
ncbi:thioredoxin [Patiriisocius marinistellae]|uniref:Thioredoxin n=1 Tax=Patiriisocius marinistellae TaxID=2494560 RepID=A0A5J4FT21_9FLAO|nr:thioredoxin family protein [Patiriisocius marinistellae]GEQ84593.1 thioredoxin [Patiriisocius marinistellae]